MASLWHRRGVLTGAGAGFAAAVLPGGPRAAEPKSITVAMPAPTTLYAPHLVAQARGAFRERGLNVDIETGTSGSRVRRMLDHRQVDFAIGDMAQALQIANRGKPVSVLMALDRRCAYANIIVRRDLHDVGIRDLRALATMTHANGSRPTIAATGRGSGSWLFGRHILETLAPDGAVDWVAGGKPDAMIAGLENGEFDAMMALPAWRFVAETKGVARVLFDAGSEARWRDVFGGPFPTTVVYSLAETSSRYVDLTQRYLGALHDSLAWMKDAEPGDIQALIGERFLARFPADLVAREIAYYQPVWRYDGMLPESDFTTGGKVWFRPDSPLRPVAYQEVVNMRPLADVSGAPR